MFFGERYWSPLPYRDGRVEVEAQIQDSKETNEARFMRDLFKWFGLFLLVCVILGWAEFGGCWMFCEVIVGQKFFWPLMGFPVSFNIGISFLWLGVMAE